MVVTGLGVVSALGPDVDAFRDGLFAGRSGIAPLSLFDCQDARSQLVAQAVEPVSYTHLAANSRNSPVFPVTLAKFRSSGLSSPPHVGKSRRSFSLALRGRAFSWVATAAGRTAGGACGPLRFVV